MKILSGIIVVLALTIGGQSRVLSQDASGKFCNKTDEKISFAIAGFDAESKSYGWRSKGWFNLAPEECITGNLSQFRGRHLFFYAEGGGVYWRGGYLFCVHAKNGFDLTGVGDCSRHGDGHRAERFFHRLREDGQHAVNFTFE